MKNLNDHSLQSILIITNVLPPNSKIIIEIIAKDLLINWGDGNTNSLTTHKYSTSKNYIIKITAKNIYSLNLTSQNVKYIKFENCTDLYYLNCQFNSICELDISGLKNIEHLKCNDNRISKIKFGRHRYLYSLNCEGNQLYSLNLSGHANNIQLLCCAENHLMNLGIQKCSKLWRIDCRNNPLDADTIINSLPKNSNDWQSCILFFNNWENKYISIMNDKNWTLQKRLSLH